MFTHERPRGNAIRDDAGVWHLFSTEIAGGAGCGLHDWQRHSTVIHSTADAATGPFVRRGVALPAQAHNPQAIRMPNGTWAIFHIGSAQGAAGRAPNCSALPPPTGFPSAWPGGAMAAARGCPAAPEGFSLTPGACISAGGCNGTHCNCGAALASGDCEGAEQCVAEAAKRCAAMAGCRGFAVGGRSAAADCGGNVTRWMLSSSGAGSAVPNMQWSAYLGPEGPPPRAPSTLHVATHPEGPWTPVMGAPHCNNPSPFVHPNGTLFLACTWKLYSAPGLDGPWSDGVAIPVTGGRGHWEDPFLFIDRRGGFHILAHVYTTQPYPEGGNPISGHAFSTDGVTWNLSDTQPYSDLVTTPGKTAEHFATIERPKLLWDAADPYTPVALTNGGSPYWDASNASDPCHACGDCCRCKVLSRERGGAFDFDWTLTLVRPVLP